MISEPKYSEFKGLKITKEQAQKWDEWPDTADYLRTCIDTRYSNNAEELKRRATELRMKAQELMIAATECDRLAEADHDLVDAHFARYMAEWKEYGRSQFARDTNLRWMMDRYGIKREQALDFLTYIGDARGDQEHDG